MSKINDLLKIKKTQDLYQFTVKQTPEEIVDLIFELSSKRKKHVAFMVFAMCDYCAKTNREKSLLKFIKLLDVRGKKDKKFNDIINKTLTHIFNSLEEPKKKKVEPTEPKKELELPVDEEVEPPKDQGNEF
jgi:hypothetical protein